jgi:hypothetical protein
VTLLTTLLVRRVIDRCNADTGESEPAGDVHCRDYVLVPCIGVGTDRQRQSVIAAGYFLQRITNRLDAAVDEFAAVDQKHSRIRDHDIDLLRDFLHNSRAIGLREADRNLRLLDETGRYHEENQQQQHHIDQRGQVDLGLRPRAQIQFHRLGLFLAPVQGFDELDRFFFHVDD